GGVLEFIRDGVNGRVVDPDPRALAKAIDDLASEERARTLGRHGPEYVRDLTWDTVVDSLVDGAD
ncbi:MAG: glycosyltransferase, partial [Chloroflexota bacterium]